MFCDHRFTSIPVDGDLTDTSLHDHFEFGIKIDDFVGGFEIWRSWDMALEIWTTCFQTLNPIAPFLQWAGVRSTPVHL
jgi:hypothetical protein